MERNVGTLLVVLGIGLVAVGALTWMGAFGWFGRLPGDIRIETGSTRVFIPVTSMIVLSVVATLVLNVVARLLR
ncbi:MAG: DUF2905 domain-containing protein [Nitriliruptoraceae bacterium]